jgi:ariadne-1
MSSLDEFSDTMDEDSQFDFESEEDQDFAFDPVVPDSKKSYEVDYSIWKPIDIVEKQRKDIEDVTTILGCESEIATTLLWHFKWNKERLIESFMENEEKVKKEAGVHGNFKPEFKIIKNFCCDICCSDDENLTTFALSCNHRYCTNCYKHYITQKIKEEGESRHISCPGECTLVLDEKTVKSLVEPDVFEKYILFM